MARPLAIAMTLLMVAAAAVAQTTAAPGIDLEVYNSADGSNRFCAEPESFFWAKVLVRPGDGSLSCTPACGSVVAGGSAALATGVVDLSFDATELRFSVAETNSSTVAAQGLIEDNSTAGRIGWALAGNWSTPGDPSSGLLDPCQMEMLDTAGWVLRVRFAVRPEASGISVLHLRRQTDASPFALSFADICGSPAFTIASGAVDEVVDGTVIVADDCAQVLFYDSLESGDTSAWSLSTAP